MATNCSLYRDKISEALQEFSVLEGCQVQLTSSHSGQEVYKLTKDGSNCILTIYFKNNGLTSISHSSSKKLEKIGLGEKCERYLIDNTSVPDNVHKTFTIKNSKIDNFIYFKESVSEEFIISEVSTADSSVENRFSVTDATGATVTVTLYTNDTLLLQGRVTPLFVNTMRPALEWMTNESDSVEKCLNLSNQVVTIDEDLSHHINNLSPFYPDAELLLKLIKTSLQLANSGIVLSDYACYTFDILRSIEGLLKFKLLCDFPEIHDFGDYFVKQLRTNTYVFISTITTYNSRPGLKRALEHAYTFYHANRHSTFHVDSMIETTRTLTYAEALTIIQDSISIINDICDNW